MAHKIGFSIDMARHGTHSPPNLRENKSIIDLFEEVVAQNQMDYVRRAEECPGGVKT